MKTNSAGPQPRHGTDRGSRPFGSWFFRESSCRERGIHNTEGHPRTSHARAPSFARTPVPLTSEPASLGIQIQFKLPPPPALQSSSSRASLPPAPDSLSGIYKHFPQINICIDYSLWGSRVSLVIQLAEVGQPKPAAGEKTTEEVEGPSSCWVCGCRQHRKEERGRLRTKELDEGGGERGSNSKKDEAMAAHLVPGLGWEWAPILCLLFRSRCPGPSAWGARSDSQFWHLLRKSFGGFLGLLTGRGKKAAAVRGKTRLLPTVWRRRHAVAAWLAWNSLQLCDGTRRENN